MNQHRPAEDAVQPSPAALSSDRPGPVESIDTAAGDLAGGTRNAGDQSSDVPGPITPLSGLTSFGDPDAGACIDGVCDVT